MKHWLLCIALICFGSSAQAAAEGPLKTANSDIKIETRNVNTAAWVEFLGVTNSSGAYQVDRKRITIVNADGTAANGIYISSSSSAGTDSAILLPGGYANKTFEWGSNIRIFIKAVTGTVVVKALSEQ